MNKKSFILLVNIFAVILQTSFFLEIFGKSANPNLVAVLVFSLLVSGETTLAFTSALFGGLLLDFVSGGTVGLTSLALTIFVWIYSQISSFYLRGFFARTIFVTASFYLIQLMSAKTLIIDPWLLVGALFGTLLGQILSFFLRGYREKIIL